MWNNSADRTIIRWKVMPALHTEYFLETVTGLANDDKTNKDGMPDILQVALLAEKHNKEFSLAKPPYFILKIAFYLLAPLAWLGGKKAVYKKYLD